MAIGGSEDQTTNSSISSKFLTGGAADGGAQRQGPALESQLQKLIIRQVFAQFIESAERKLNEIDFDALDKDKDLSLSILTGADADFDSKINNLAQIASHCPKLMIDSIMIWRGQGRNQAAEMAEIQKNKYPNVSLTDLENRIKRRISLVSNFILCRVLIAIIENLGNKPFNSELGKRLEDMVFGQLRSADPEQTARFVNLAANIKLFSQLMGTLSNTRFPTISDRFVTEIRQIQETDKANEAKLELMIKCMHYLKLKIYPMNALEESADFLQAISELFQDSTSIRIKLALCHLFNDLLEPVAQIADAEVNVPVWQNTIEVLAPKVMAMVQKGKNLDVFLSFMATLLTVSKREYFLKSWPNIVETLASRFIDKSLKNLVLKSTCKLIWTYLFRCFESPSSTVQKKIDYFAKMFFPPKRPIYPSECDLDIFVRIIYYALVKYSEYGNEELITLLLTNDVDGTGGGDAESFTLGRAENSQLLEKIPYADRLFIAFRAFILILRDVEQSISDKDNSASAISALQSQTGLVLVEGKLNLTPPDFPTFDDQFDYSFKSLSKIGSRDVKMGRKNFTDQNYPLNLPLSRETQLKMGSGMRDTLKLINVYVGQVFLTLDEVIGPNMMSEPPAPEFLNPYTSQATKLKRSTTQVSSKHKPSSSTHSIISESTSFTGIPYRQDSVIIVNSVDRHSLETAHRVYTGLLQTIFDSIPRFYPSGISPVNVIEMLTRYSVLHNDSKVQQSAFNSICRIAKVKRIDPDAVNWNITVDSELFSASVFRIFNDSSLMAIRNQFVEIWMVNGKFEEIYDRLAQRKLALLDIWLEDICHSTTYSPSQNEVDSIVQLLESQGLFYLCSRSPNIRKTAIMILKKSQDFREKLLEKMPQRKADVLKESIRGGINTFERLSIFQGAKRASLYKRAGAVNDKRPYISIYDILVDQGEQIVRQNISNSSTKGMSSDSSSESLRKMKAHNASLLAKDNPFLVIAQSTHELDIILWNRCFSLFLKSLVDYASKECLKKALNTFWGFLQIMQPVLHNIAEEIALYRNGFTLSIKNFENAKFTPTGASADTFLEYWRMYASFSYSSFQIYMIVNEPIATHDTPPFSICSPGELNRNVLPLLGAGKHEVRKAALSALSCIQTDGYGPLLRDTLPYMLAIINNTHSSGKKQAVNFDHVIERVRTQLAHLLTYIANFTKIPEFRKQKGMMNTFHDYIKVMTLYFSDPEVRTEWKHQITRFYFCSFIEKYYRNLTYELKNDEEQIEKFLGFKAKRDLFILFEGWCGFGVDGAKSRIREAKMISKFLEANRENAAALSARVETHRKSLQIACLKAIAALCQGPLVSRADPQLFLKVDRILIWIDGLLETGQRPFQIIAKSAIENVFESNMTNEYLINQILNNCYSQSGLSKLTVGYFLGLVNLMVRKNELIGPTGKVATLCLYQLGSENFILRKGAGSLLSLLEKSLSNQLEDEKSDANDLFIDSIYGRDTNFDIDDELSVDEDQIGAAIDIESLLSSSTVPAIYKKSQIEAAKKLARDHPELAMEVLNEATLRVQSISSNSEEDVRKIRNFLLILTAWLPSFYIIGNFSVERTHEFSSSEQLTWNILYNLFYLTARCTGSDIFNDDIHDLWTELLSVKSKGISFIDRQRIVKSKLYTISDFLAVNAFSLQSSRAISVTKNIAIILANTEFGACLIEHIVGKLTPQSIGPISDSVMATIINAGKVASKGHSVELSGSAPTLQNTSKLSLSYLYMLQLIDCSLTLDKYTLIIHLPILLHVTIIQLDSARSEEMRMLLVFLIQSIISSDRIRLKNAEPVLKALTLKEGKPLWRNEDPTPENPEPESAGQMAALTLEILEIFFLVHPSLKYDWTELALKWGTTCTDSHSACRSLQIHRGFKPKLSFYFLAQVVESLSTAVSDSRTSMQSYSLDLLLTIKYVYQGIESSKFFSEYPHLFWISLALFSSVHEWEYQEGLSLLHCIIKHIDLTKMDMIHLFMSSMPIKWPGGFHGVLIPLTRGLRSSKTCDLALNIINSLVSVPIPAFLDTRSSKMLFTVLANLPKILQPYEYNSGSDSLFDHGHSVIESSLQLAEKLASACGEASSTSLALLLTSFSKERIRKRDDFFRQIAAIIKDEYRSIEGEVVQFCLSLLSNSSFIYPNCFLSLLECLWQDLSQRPNATALPSDITGAWLKPLITLLDSPLGFRAARLLEIMLSVRLKASETEITRNVGGAQNIFAVLKKSKSDESSFLPTGWFMEDFQSEAAILTKKRLLSVAKSLRVMAEGNHEVSSNLNLQQKSIVYNSETKIRLMAQFADHGAHFQSLAL